MVYTVIFCPGLLVVLPMFSVTLSCCQHLLVLFCHRCVPAPRRIADALEKAGLKGKRHPQDYLQFFCLGKRESNDMYWGGVSEQSMHVCCMIGMISMHTGGLNEQSGTELSSTKRFF